MKAHIIIQVRLGSTRLPGKALLKVLDKTMLEYLIERVNKAKTIEGIVLATTTKEEDSKIVNLAREWGLSFYRGSENDVLDRFYQAARLIGAKHMVRITGDCPLIDPSIIDNVVDFYHKSGADYCSNTLEETFPDGEDVEVFSFDVLKSAWENATLLSEREHVTPYIRKHPEKFTLTNVKNKTDLSDKRWTLDTEKDFEFIKAVLESLYPKNRDFGMKDILQFLQANPQLENVNKGIPRNEGYFKSLKEDRVINTEFTEE